ncbi:6-phosphogluconolactonase [Castellaniella sp.]|uniref:6-phosphogluconolactonase n=1 Tax=Castellaniella sp. TaxID=1955812 RepID=UPI002AFF52C5|nr:6-phosphogluconolactonase [Castellaniella sp.]
MTLPIWHLTASPQEQAHALAQLITRDLRVALHQRGTARLAVSGGRSPVPLLEALSRSPLPWSDITVMLVDERCVPPTSPDSNEALIRQHLLHRAAALARFSPPKPGPIDPPAALDVLVLGMGADGHTASLFPDDPALDQALDLKQPPAYLAVQPVSSPWRRLTLNLSAIVQAERIYVAIAGAAKRRVLEQALLAGPSRPPIGVVLAASAARAGLHWCPEPDQAAP